MQGGSRCSLATVEFDEEIEAPCPVQRSNDFIRSPHGADLLLIYYTRAQMLQKSLDWMRCDPSLYETEPMPKELAIYCTK
jgi:hypothetical protein